MSLNVIIKCGYIPIQLFNTSSPLTIFYYTLRLVPILLIPYSSSIYSYIPRITTQYNDSAHRRKGESLSSTFSGKDLTCDSYESVLSLISLSGKRMDLGMNDQLVNILTSSD